MKASQRRIITAAAAILIVIVSGLVIRNCGTGKQEEVKIKSGQTRSMGSVKWSIVSVMKVRTIEPSGANITANGWFMVIDFYLTNQSKEKIQFNADSLVLTDGSGKTYAPNKKATEAQLKSMGNSEVGSIFNTALNPGKQQRLSGAFDISETATKLQLRILGDKYGSKEDLVIDLGF